MHVLKFFSYKVFSVSEENVAVDSDLTYRVTFNSEQELNTNYNAINNNFVADVNAQTVSTCNQKI